MRRLLVGIGYGGIAAVILGASQLFIMAVTAGDFDGTIPASLYALIVGGATAVGVLVDTESNPPHRHDWGKWQEHGITFQQRQCRTCGKYKIKSQ